VFYIFLLLHFLHYFINLILHVIVRDYHVWPASWLVCVCVSVCDWYVCWRRRCWRLLSVGLDVDGNLSHGPLNAVCSVTLPSIFFPDWRRYDSEISGRNQIEMNSGRIDWSGAARGRERGFSDAAWKRATSMVGRRGRKVRILHDLRELGHEISFPLRR